MGGAKSGTGAKSRESGELLAPRRSVRRTGDQSRRTLLDLDDSLLLDELLDWLEGAGRLADELRDGAGDDPLVELRDGADEGRLVDELRGAGAGRLTELEPLGALGATTLPRLLDDPLGLELESRSGTMRAPPMRSITRRGIGAELVSWLRVELAPSPSRPVSLRWVGELRHWRSGAGVAGLWPGFGSVAQLRSGAGRLPVVQLRSGAGSGVRSGSGRTTRPRHDASSLRRGSGEVASGVGRGVGAGAVEVSGSRRITLGAVPRGAGAVAPAAGRSIWLPPETGAGRVVP